MEQKFFIWPARILGLCILVVALPFYFGYGNPLPFFFFFYSVWENVALTLLPVILLSLALGWRYPKVAAYIILLSLFLVFIVGVFSKAQMSANLFIPFLPGIFYLLAGQKKNKRTL